MVLVVLEEACMFFDSPLGFRGGDRRRDDEEGEASGEDAGDKGGSGEADNDFLCRP